MVRTILSGAVLGLSALAVAPSPVAADPVCVCITIRSFATSETSTGYKCQEVPPDTWHRQQIIDYPPWITVTVEVFSPTQGSRS